MSPDCHLHMYIHTVGNAAPCGHLCLQWKVFNIFFFPLYLQSEDTSLLAPPSISMVIPVTVPVQSSGPAKVCRSRKRRCSDPVPTTGHAVLYRSLLHQETAVGGDREVTGGDGVSGVHYTPPPMLCPFRAGPGLYCSLTTRRQQRVQTVQLHNTHGEEIL